MKSKTDLNELLQETLKGLTQEWENGIKDRITEVQDALGDRVGSLDFLAQVLTIKHDEVDAFLESFDSQDIDNENVDHRNVVKQKLENKNMVTNGNDQTVKGSEISVSVVQKALTLPSQGVQQNTDVQNDEAVGDVNGVGECGEPVLPEGGVTDVLESRTSQAKMRDLVPPKITETSTSGAELSWILCLEHRGDGF
eukprot:Trichotokara_eunicae@DN6335_c0_g1_i5.p1